MSQLAINHVNKKKPSRINRIVNKGIKKAGCAHNFFKESVNLFFLLLF